MEAAATLEAQRLGGCWQYSRVYVLVTWSWVEWKEGAGREIDSFFFFLTQGKVLRLLEPN